MKASPQCLLPSATSHVLLHPAPSLPPPQLGFAPDRRVATIGRRGEHGKIRGAAMRDSAPTVPSPSSPSRHVVEAPPQHLPPLLDLDLSGERRGGDLHAAEKSVVEETWRQREKETRWMAERWWRRRTRSGGGGHVLSVAGKETKRERETRGWGA